MTWSHLAMLGYVIKSKSASCRAARPTCRSFARFALTAVRRDLAGQMMKSCPAGWRIDGDDDDGW